MTSVHRVTVVETSVGSTSDASHRDLSGLGLPQVAMSACEAVIDSFVATG